jgi:DNA-binding beta-propeller fold protein YncE
VIALKRSLAFAFLLLGVATCANGDPAAKVFTVLGDVPLGPRVDRTDYESIDPTANRLYIANMGGGQLLVFDLAQNRLVARLDGFPKVTGVLAVPELHKVYVSVPGAGVLASLFVGLGMAGLSSGRGKIAIYDSERLHKISWLAGGVFPDGLAYDPRDRRVFVSDELGSAVIAIDADTNKATGRIATGGQVGNVRYDPATGKIFAPVQSENQLVSIDPIHLAINARFALKGCEHPHGFIVAPRGAVGFVACDQNDRLLSVELATGEITNNQLVAHDPDVLALDAGLNRLYVPSESGTLSTFDITSPTAPKALGQVFVGAGAHAVAVDGLSHRLYFALANIGGQMVLRELVPADRK